MDEGLKTLVELQKIDSNLTKVQKVLDEIPLQQQQVEAELAAEEKLVKNQQDRVSAHEKEQRALEMELKAKEATIEKHQAQLFACKNNKEYETVKHEIKVDQEKCEAIEEKILLIMDSLEVEQQQLASEKQVFAEKQKLVGARLAELTALQQEKTSQKETLQQAREPLSAALEDEQRNKYEKLAKIRRNLAVSKIDLTCCLGCNTILPPQLINEVMKNDRILTCNSCGRILYWEESAQHSVEKGA